MFARSGETPVTEFLRGRMKSAFSVLDAHLAGKRTFVVGRSPDDCRLFALLVILFWNDEYGIDWADYPNISAWLARIQHLPGWVHPYKLMPGHPLGGLRRPTPFSGSST